MSDETFFHGDRLLHYAMAPGHVARRSVVHETPERENGEWTGWVGERSQEHEP
jgi:hypothetical protein